MTTDTTERAGPGPADGSDGESDRSGTRKRPRKQRSFLAELPFLIVLAFILALVLRSFVVQAFYIPSESMENTLRINDKVVVDKLSYRFGPVHRGDIVVFNVIGLWKSEAQYKAELAATTPTSTLGKLGRELSRLVGFSKLDEDYYIKRVIGVGGDTVACCDNQGRVTVNGHPLNEQAYLYPGSEPSEVPFKVTVPAHHVWVMGDNRQNSGDSRAHRGDPGGGTVPVSAIAGRAFALVFPFDHATWFHTPKTFEQPGLAAGRPVPPAAAATADDAMVPADRARHSGREPLPESTLSSAAAAAVVLPAWPRRGFRRRR